MLFVSHDLRVVRHLAHEVAVMYLGRVVEFGSADAVFAAPQHPYTQGAVAGSAPADATQDRNGLARRAAEPNAGRARLSVSSTLPGGCSTAAAPSGRTCWSATVTLRPAYLLDGDCHTSDPVQ